MRAVARITPAANDLMAKKVSLSGWRRDMIRPRMGKRTPAALEVRMQAMAMSFRARDRLASPPLEMGMQSQAERERWGKRKRRREMSGKAEQSLVMAFLRETGDGV
ncbi:hypothetical protein HPP92_027579 [Vanilla planifolia]|uniref:Uncharacterized protein n=1 Tax=Vanilla planifolia TaxID=51239 RepID=A0A835PCA0_VANPL|nr:hypothetical protein HPP92_027579 [Vanilla planifolia]